MSTKSPDNPVLASSNREPIMSLCLTCQDDVKTIVISGELDLDTVHLLTELVDRVAAERPTRVLIDMADVTFFCAAGLAALLRARETITGIGGRLTVRAPSPITRTVLTITDTDRLLLAENTPAAA